jgi:hypothetical protein
MIEPLEFPIRNLPTRCVASRVSLGLLEGLIAYEMAALPPE